MNEDEMRALRDGRMHDIGPLSLQYTGPSEHGSEGICKIGTETASYAIDYLYGEAVAFAIDPTRDLWVAYESDKEPQGGSDEERGWLRIELTAETARLGGAPAWAGMAFQVARLVTGAETGEVVRRIGGGRSTDYRRACFAIHGGPAKAATRTSFIHASAVLGRGRQPTLPHAWERHLKARWVAADAAYDHAVALQKAFAEEP